MTGYLRPVARYTGISTFTAHTRRTTPSTEPGVDYYCPIGTPVVAPADGIVGMTGDSIIPATGRFVFIKFDNGQSGRALHLKSRKVNVGARVKRGQIIGYSGATGYGVEDWSGNPDTGGAHTHWTLWPTHTMRFGYWTDAAGKRHPYTIDPEQYVDAGSTAGDGSSTNGDDELDARQSMMLEKLYEALLPGEAGVRTQGAVNKVFTDTLAAARAAKTAAEAGTAAKVWATTVSRDGAKVSALQELADAKTAALSAVQKVGVVNVPPIDYVKLAAEIVKAGGTAPSAAAIASELAKRLAS